MLTRRELGKLALGGAALPFLSAPARATAGMRAVNLGGKSLIQQTNVAALGLTSGHDSCVTAGYCFSATTANDISFPVVIVGSTPDWDRSSFGIAHVKDAATGKLWLQVYMGNPADPNHGIFQYNSPLGAIKREGEFHQVFVHLNSRTRQANVLIDGVICPARAVTGAAFTQVWTDATLVTVGEQHIGSLAELWLNIGDAVGLSNPKTIAGLWDAKRGEPVRQSADGQSFFLTGVVKPHVYLSGGAGEFYRDNAHTDWTLNTAKPRNPWAYVGPVATSDRDPWNQPAIGVSMR